jgi:hypothetical protein
MKKLVMLVLLVLGCASAWAIPPMLPVSIPFGSLETAQQFTLNEVWTVWTGCDDELGREIGKADEDIRVFSPKTNSIAGLMVFLDEQVMRAANKALTSSNLTQKFNIIGNLHDQAGYLLFTIRKQFQLENVNGEWKIPTDITDYVVTDKSMEKGYVPMKIFAHLEKASLSVFQGTQVIFQQQAPKFRSQTNSEIWGFNTNRLTLHLPLVYMTNGYTGVLTLETTDGQIASYSVKDGTMLAPIIEPLTWSLSQTNGTWTLHLKGDPERPLVVSKVNRWGQGLAHQSGVFVGTNGLYNWTDPSPSGDEGYFIFKYAY